MLPKQNYGVLLASENKFPKFYFSYLFFNTGFLVGIEALMAELVLENILTHSPCIYIIFKIFSTTTFMSVLFIIVLLLQ